MDFNRHSRLAGQHAFLSASKHHWLGYDEEKLVATYSRHLAAQRGTQLHELACRCIGLGVRLPKSNKALNMYVNDAIGFKMRTEQTLYYSDNCFGTADAICFRKNALRIHDLKTGETPASMKQLLVYAALFCLEYGAKPRDIETELRIYQSDEVAAYSPPPEETAAVMDKIILFDKRIEEIKAEGL